MLEERKALRFDAIQGTRALACDKIAQVLDVSKGGLSLLFLDETTNCIAGELSIDILCNKNGLDARQIPGKVVWDREVSFSSIPGMVYKKVGIQFGKLSVPQQKMLKNMLFSCNTVAA